MKSALLFAVLLSLPQYAPGQGISLEGSPFLGFPFFLSGRAKLNVHHLFVQLDAGSSLIISNYKFGGGFQFKKGLWLYEAGAGTSRLMYMEQYRSLKYGGFHVHFCMSRYFPIVKLGLLLPVSLSVVRDERDGINDRVFVPEIKFGIYYRFDLLSSEAPQP